MTDGVGVGVAVAEGTAEAVPDGDRLGPLEPEALEVGVGYAVAEDDRADVTVLEPVARDDAVGLAEPRALSLGAADRVEVRLGRVDSVDEGERGPSVPVARAEADGEADIVRDGAAVAEVLGVELLDGNELVERDGRGVPDADEDELLLRLALLLADPVGEDPDVGDTVAVMLVETLMERLDRAVNEP